MQITLIIPTYNEVENLQALFSTLNLLPLDNLKILVVDDNSPDGTGELADKLSLKFPDRISVIHRSGKLGLRTAYLDGIKKVLAEGAEAVGQMDADFSHDPTKLVELASALENCDVVIGSRYIPGGSVDDRWPRWRKWLSAFGNFYARTILNMPLRDITGGYRLWRRDTLIGMPLDRIQSNGYVFMVEMAYIAYALNYKFREVPIHFADRRWGKSKMSLQIQIEAAFRVWQVKANFQDLKKKGKLARINNISK